jgi:hypothetical protein
MPTVTQKGLAVAWGITSTGYTYTGAATVLAVHATEQSLTKDAKMTESADPVTGSTLGIVFYDFTNEVQLRVYPKGSGLTAATNAAMALPAIGDKFCIIDTDTAVGASGTGTPYVVMKVGRTRKVSDKVEFDITIKAYETDLSTTAA